MKIQHKERPILFSGAMVRAIREGRKTQTRRIIKPQPRVIHAMHNDASIVTNRIFRNGDQRIHCPYGQPGDRLWVRETWGLADHHDAVYWCSQSIIGIPESELREMYVVEYAADWVCPSETGHWRPSIHMPRWASRITLEIVSVRVERLQDISASDCKAEGVQIPRCGCEVCSTQSNICTADVSEYLMAYQSLWESIHGPGSWDLNPWVWVIEFKEVKP